MCGYMGRLRVILLVLIVFFFFLSFVLVVLVCFSIFKDRALSLCTNIFEFGNIMIW